MVGTEARTIHNSLSCKTLSKDSMQMRMGLNKALVFDKLK